MKIEITKDCYIVLFIGMGNVDVIPDFCKKGKIINDVGFPSKKTTITTQELKDELKRNKVGTAFLEGTDYEYESVMVQAPHSAFVPVGCFNKIE